MKYNYKITYTVSIEDAQEAEDLIIAYSNNAFEEHMTTDGKSCFSLYYNPNENLWHEILSQKLQEQCGAHVTYTTEEDTDWVSHWKASCTPVQAGIFYIIPEWHDIDTPAELLPIYLTPRMAFGTGHHASTALCLEAISSYSNNEVVQSGRFLDLGTGSGILAIALSLLGMSGDAIDIDPISITNAQENIHHNNVENAITLYTGTISTLSYERKYTFIVANILAPILIEIADTIIEYMEINAFCILSGILSIQMDSVIKHYEARQCICVERKDSGEWSMCVLQYKG